MVRRLVRFQRRNDFYFQVVLLARGNDGFFDGGLGRVLVDISQSVVVFDGFTSIANNAEVLQSEALIIEAKVSSSDTSFLQNQFRVDAASISLNYTITVELLEPKEDAIEGVAIQGFLVINKRLAADDSFVSSAIKLVDVLVTDPAGTTDTESGILALS